MPCLICGDPKTVRSHIIPKAIVASIADENGVIMGSRFYSGAKPSPRGRFNDHILCTVHEGQTSLFDKYAVEFIRRADRAFEAQSSALSFDVDNPNPRLLSRFALSMIWREVNSPLPAAERRTLGPYASAVANAIFCEGRLDWPVLIQRQDIRAGQDQPLRFAVHPYQVRLLDRLTWTWSMSGYAFFVVSDRRGATDVPDCLLANLSDPVTVLVGDALPIEALTAFRPIFQRMRRQ